MKCACIEHAGGMFADSRTCYELRYYVRPVHLGSPGCHRIGWQLPRDNIALFCANGHDHLMAWEQAQRLYLEPCCWCGAPLVRAIHGPNVPIRVPVDRN